MKVRRTIGNTLNVGGIEKRGEETKTLKLGEGGRGVRWMGEEMGTLIGGDWNSLTNYIYIFIYMYTCIYVYTHIYVYVYMFIYIRYISPKTKQTNKQANKNCIGFYLKVE